MKNNVLTYFSVNKVDVDDMISTFNNGKSIVVTKHASDAIKKLEILKFVIKALKIHFIHHLEHKIGFAFLDVFENDAIASHSINIIVCTSTTLFYSIPSTYVYNDLDMPS